MKLIDNLPNQDKKDYLIKLKDSIDIPVECRKKEKAKDEKEKTKMKQDRIDIKQVTL